MLVRESNALSFYSDDPSLEFSQIGPFTGGPILYQSSRS